MAALAADMRNEWILLLPLLAVSACDGSIAGMRNGSGSGASAASIPAPMLFVPEDAHASVFEDHHLAIDVVQIYAHEDSSGTAVFLQFPAAMAAQAGTYPLDPSADPAVFGWFATSGDGHHDLDWQFALHDANLVVVTAGSSQGATLAVSLNSAAFVFENDHGHQNSAISALVSAIDPPLSAELGHEPLMH